MQKDETRWQVRFEAFDADDEHRREALLALGNGVLSWRAAAPEASAADDAAPDVHYTGFYRAGWYDDGAREVNGEPVRLEALVNLPDPFGLSVSLDGRQWFGSVDVPLLAYRQSLYMDRARLEREISFQLAGKIFRLREIRLLSLANPHLALLRWELQCPPGVERVQVRSVVDAGVENALIGKNRAYEGKRLRDLVLEPAEGGRATLSARLETPGRRLAMAVHVCHPGQIQPWRSECQGERLLQQTECDVENGRLVIEKRVIVQVDSELPSTAADARKQVLACLPTQAFARLHLRHARAWQRLWAQAPLGLSDAGLEKSLRLHSFHLLQTISPHSPGRDLGFPPRGWHEGYFGQVFWDEIFAYPFLSSHLPDLARGLLDYRYRRLDMARERARIAGLRGAMFPWRSAGSGREQTPPFQCNPLSGRWMPDYTYRQRHVGAAIAHDAWQLYLATGDQGLLTGQAGELILDIARFWASLARWDEARSRFVILGVIGPDEYHNLRRDGQPGLDNNAYTNLMAVWSLRLALDVLAALPESAAQALCSRLDIQPGERDIWHDMTRRMFLPIRPDGVLLQFDGFEQLEPVPDAWMHEDHPRLDWMLEARGDRPDRYRLAKQADVLMLLYLFPGSRLGELIRSLGYAFDEHALRRTAAFNLSSLTHESSLSLVVCAGALAGIDPAASWRFFQQSAGIDLEAPPDGGTLEGVHLGAMAGSLDVLQRHYLGVRAEHDGLQIAPAPPAALGNVRLSVQHRGAWLRLTLEGQTLLLCADPANRRDIPITTAAGAKPLAPGERLAIACERR
ncbi:glycoside hydrolase family 65 protein [Stutzerimonas stutzeri]